MNKIQTGRESIQIDPAQMDQFYQAGGEAWRKFAKEQIDKQTGRDCTITDLEIYRLQNRIDFSYFFNLEDQPAQISQANKLAQKHGIKAVYVHFGQPYLLDDVFSGKISDQMIASQKAELEQRGYKAIRRNYKKLGLTAIYIAKNGGK